MKNNTTNITSEGASKKLVPELRFPEFVNEGEWEYIPLCQVSHRITGKCKGDEGLCVLTNSATGGIVRQQDYFEREIVTKSNLGNYQILDVDDFVYNPRISTAAPVGPISRNKLVKGIMSPLYTIFRFRSGNKDFLEQYFGTTSWHKYIKAKANFGARHDRINITTDDFFKLPIPQPESREQQKIAQCLSSLDELIATTKEKVELLKEHKRGLMQKLFPAKGKTLPELRFSEFKNEGEWEEYTLGEITNVTNRRNKSNRRLPIYSISNKGGFIPQSEQFDGLDSNRRGYDISMYKLVGKNTFAYNPARINVGSIGYSGDLKEVIISSLYVCFKTTEKIEDDFLSCFTNTILFRQAVDNNVEGGIRSYLFYENFSKIKIWLPTIPEQKKITLLFQSIDDIIDNYSLYLEYLELHKKGLMQKIFPKIR